MKKIIILIIVFFPSLSYGVKYIDTLPYTCAIPGETYIVTKDLSTPETAIFIKAGNIKINLNGKTVTFGTGNMPSDGIQLKKVWGVNNIEIFGGKIIHKGTGNPPNCSGIAIHNFVSGIKIHDLVVVARSRSDANGQSCGILLIYAHNVEIYNCNIDNQASGVVNRHSLMASGIHIHLDDSSPSCKVYGNTVKSTHQGIGLLTTNSWKSSGNRVYNNSVSINQCGSTNGYALFFYRINDLQAYSNTINNITGRGGRGIVLNTVSNFDVFDNNISSREGRTNESSQTNGIRIRWGCKYGKVHNNSVNVYAGQTIDFGDAYGIYVTEGEGSPLGVDVQIYENIINAVTYDTKKKAYAIYIEFMEPNLNYMFKDNIVNTNSRAIRFDAGWDNTYPCQGLRFYRTKITKVLENSSNFHTYELFGKKGVIKNISMIDTLYFNGASEDDVIFNEHLSDGELLHVLTCKFMVKDIAGNNIQGATVKVNNNQAVQVFYGTTNINGESVCEIPYKKHSKPGGKVDLNPFRLTASYDCRLGLGQINVSNINKEFSVNLPSKKTFPCP
jgi:hypothetical protein